MKQLKQGLLLLLVSAMLCGCSLMAQPAGPDPNSTSTAILSSAPPEEPVPTPEPTPTPIPKEELKRQEREKKQQDGFVVEQGYLYAVEKNGEPKCNTYIGVLFFDKYGRYTSGSKELDRLVAAVIRKNTTERQTRMQKLKAMYEYTRDNIKYLGFGNHDLSYEPAHGKDGWMTDCAIYALENGVGNCYHFAATFAALARGLGYQAYATSGVIGSQEQQHGWVEILDEAGNIWYSDPETEYSRIYWLQEKHDLFYKSKEDISATTGILYMQMKDPFEAEAAEARERALSSLPGS